MNLLDLLIIVTIVLAAVGGYRLGFLARSLSWIGLTIALLIAIWLVPDLMNALKNTAPRGRLFAALAFVVGLGLLGQALGLALGSLVLRRIQPEKGVEQTDRAAGAVIGALGVVVFVWMLVPALASAPGWPAREARGSAIVDTIEHVAPEPPASLRELGRMVAPPFPEVFGRGDEPGSAGAPPTSGLSAVVDQAVVPSIVQVEGRACDQIQDGSGFVAAPGVVVTNAHVVAGENDTSVITADGTTLRARVVRFDPRRDLAVLRVPGLRAAALPISSGTVGATGAVYGHPGGGPLLASPARIAERITARGTDIYRTSTTERDVFVLAASLAPGDSGAPLVNASGQVVGVAFAIDPGNATTAYALTDAELRPVLRDLPNTTAETGSCLVG